MRTQFKMFFMLVLCLALAVAASAQAPIVVKSVNYGNGAVVTETEGYGSPASSCTGLARYTQLDATAGQNTWLCISGTMVQQRGVNATCNVGSPSGTCQFSNQVVAPSVATGSTPTGPTFTLNALSTIPANWTLDVTTPTTALQTLVPGLSPGASAGAMYLSGDSVAKNPATSASDTFYVGCTNEVNNGWAIGGSTSWTGTKHSCFEMGYTFAAPSVNFGTTMGTAGQHGPGGWSTHSGIGITAYINSPGISELFAGTQYKAGIGDNTGFYLYNYNYGGFVAGSDEGNHVGALDGGEATASYAGTVKTGGGGTGATTVKINCTADCTLPGDGRFLTDGSTTTSNRATAVSNFSNTVASMTVATPVTVSTGWWALSGDVKTPVNNDGNPAGAGYTTMTMTLASTTLYSVANSGTPTVGADICFSGSYWEHAKIATVSGSGPWTVTAPLRHAHLSGTYVMQGGLCGQFADFTANDVVNSGTTFHFPFPVLGAVNGTTIVVPWLATQAPSQPLAATNVHFADTGVSLSYSGGLVTMANFTANARPYMVGQSSITISNASDSTFNGTCTNSAVTSAGLVTCTPSGTPGASATGATVSISGTNPYGNTDFTLQCGAEVLDVLDYTTSPAKVSPGNVTTFTLEPNNCAWPNSGAVEQPHHYSSKVNGLHIGINYLNPYSSPTNTADIVMFGYPHGQAQGSTSGSYAFGISNSPNNNNMYAYHGGSYVPPGGIFMPGLFSSGLIMQYAPDGPGASVMSIGCPLSGCTDPFFFYNLWSLTGNGGTSAIVYTPSTRALAFSFNSVDFNGAPITRPFVKSYSNTAPAAINFLYLDSGGVQHQTGLQANSAATAYTIYNLPAGSGGTHTLATNDVFVASGASHASGVVPDPGSTAGSTRFLREDATWVAPTLPVKYTPSWTPSVVTASTCAEQTFTVTGAVAGQAVLSANPPSALSHVWIGSKRVSAANTVAVEFCGDATGGTPPTGTWTVVLL